MTRICTRLCVVSGLLGSSLVDGSQSFGEACCLFLKLRMRFGCSEESDHETQGKGKVQDPDQFQWERQLPDSSFKDYTHYSL
jgi:hypothetical protein